MKLTISSRGLQFWNKIWHFNPSFNSMSIFPTVNSLGLAVSRHVSSASYINFSRILLWPFHYEPILDLDEQSISLGAIGVHNSGNSHSTRYGINCWILQLTSDYTRWRDRASDVCKSIITVVSVSTLKEISWIMGNPDCFWVIFLNWNYDRKSQV